MVIRMVTWVVMGALDVTALSAVAGRRTVSLMGCVVWKSCRVCVQAVGVHPWLLLPRTGHRNCPMACRDVPQVQPIVRHISGISVQQDTRLTGADGQNPGVGNGRCYRVLDALVSILQRT